MEGIKEDGGNYDNDLNSVQIEEVKIKCEEYLDERDSTSTYVYAESYKVEVKYETGNIKQESCIHMDTLQNTEDLSIKIENSTNEKCDSLLKRIKCEQSLEIDEPSNKTIDTKEHIKEEDEFLAVDVKVEGQESEIDMGSTKFEVLTEELYIKPDMSFDENSDANSDRVTEEQMREKELGVMLTEADVNASVSFKMQQCKYCSNKTTTGCSCKQNSCAHCNATFGSKKALDDHTLKNHREFIASVSYKIHECKYCSYKTTISSRLIRHLKKHPESGCSVEKSSCRHCDATFRSNRALDDHIVKNHREFIASVSTKIHECKHCSYKTAVSSHLVSHLAKHPESGFSVQRNSCRHCNATFKRKIALDDHIVKSHKAFIASVSSKIHECPDCHYKTTYVTHFTSHVTKHSGIGCSVKELFPCRHCNASFKGKKTLDDHIVKNHEEFIASVSSEIHQCKHCSYKTTNTVFLARHISKHSETGFSDKQASCAHCNATFGSKKALDDHIVKNHREFIASVSYKIHECNHCSYKTTISSHLVNHLKKHPESGCSVEECSCRHCDVTFRSKKALDDHIVKNHREFIASVSTKIHECKHCSYKTTISSHLVSHLTKHPEFGYIAKRSSCRHCNATFKRKIALDDHIVKNHKAFIASDVSSKIHECPHCHYKTTMAAHLAGHMTKHSETGCSVKPMVKPMPCEYCNVIFRSKKALDDHIVANH